MSDSSRPDRQDGGTPLASPSAKEKSRITSDELFSGGKELVIDHAGEEYRLRLTSKGRLILTK